MRRSAGLIIPVSIIISYYGLWFLGALWFVERYPGAADYLPLGGLGDLAAATMATFADITSSQRASVLQAGGPVRLMLAILGSVVATIPVSWAYFITSRQNRIDQSFVQTIVILPVVVTGIAMIVMNNIALAFSLAGIVAAVRFRFSLAMPSDAMYIFVAIAIGLGAGIGDVGVSMVISAAFVATTLCIWRLEYGKTISGPFIRMIARRDTGDDDY